MSLQGHGVSNPEMLAWALTALVCLELARQNLDMTLHVMQDVFKIPMGTLRNVFRQFSLERVEKSCNAAIERTEKGVTGLCTSKEEERNIQLGIEVLQDEWTDTKKHLRIANDTIGCYDEIFRTRGEMKKLQREMSDLENEITEDEKRRNYGRIRTRLAEAANGGRGSQNAGWG